MSLTKHASIAAQCAKIETMDRMEDAISFVFVAGGTIIRIALTVIFFQALYGQVQTIGGWELSHLYVLLGTWFFIDGIAWATYIRGYNRLGRFIENGDFDLFLIKPVNLKAFFNYRYIDLVFSTPSWLVAVGIIAYGASISETPIYVPVYLLFLSLGFVIHHSFTLLLATVNFYYIIETPHYLRDEILRLGQFPISIYKGLAKFAMSFVIPLAFMFTNPAKAFFGNMSLPEAVQAIALAIIFYILADKFWKRGLRRYESAKG